MRERCSQSTYGGLADGSLLDAALLAAVAALRSLQLPAVAVNEEGAVVPSAESNDAAVTQPDSRWAT
jgi:exosome complex component RRP43